MQDVLTNPFTYGLLLGLIIGGLVAFNAWRGNSALKGENRRLREHLHTQMTINARGNDDLTTRLEQLRQQNENLRISLANLKNKPDRAELRKLYIYDRAVHLMYQRSPGFAPAWESVVAEAEEEMQQVDSGMMAWVRKALRQAPPAKPVDDAPRSPDDSE